MTAHVVEDTPLYWQQPQQQTNWQMIMMPGQQVSFELPAANPVFNLDFSESSDWLSTAIRAKVFY